MQEARPQNSCVSAVPQCTISTNHWFSFNAFNQSEGLSLPCSNSYAVWVEERVDAFYHSECMHIEASYWSPSFSLVQTIKTIPIICPSYAPGCNTNKTKIRSADVLQSNLESRSRWSTEESWCMARPILGTYFLSDQERKKKFAPCSCAAQGCFYKI